MATSLMGGLWFNGQAKEAVNFYVSLLPESEITNVALVGSAGPGAEGDILAINFTLQGREFMALNAEGGPVPSNAFSMVVLCDTQDEIDRLWAALLEGGKEQWCGWLTDRYGMAWQIVPRQMPWLVAGSDTEKSARAMQAMMTMIKLDIAALQAAYDGE